MGLFHAWIVGRTIARAMKVKPRTANELAKDAALGLLYFLCFIGFIVLCVCIAVNMSAITEKLPSFIFGLVGIVAVIFVLKNVLPQAGTPLEDYKPYPANNENKTYY